MFSDLFITKETSIFNAMNTLDRTAKKILIVVENDILIGVVTDGDIRRWILNNGDLGESVELIMNKKPVCVRSKDRKKARSLMRKHLINAVPVINDKKEIVDVIFWHNQRPKFKTLDDISVVIMAGGKGTRLYPYTKILPKPLIPIGETPIVERIINRFSSYGVEKFYLTVNYRKNMIKSYFEDIQKNYFIDFVEEDKPLGTGGSLSLLKKELKGTFIVSNCDILIEADYDEILDFHRQRANKITVVTSLKNFKIPYGVIKLNEDGSIRHTVEKPEYNHLVNTGLYIVEADLIPLIPNNDIYHMTQLVEDCVKQNLKVGTFPVSEYSWLDMGQFEEMNRMVSILEEKDKDG